VPSNAVAECAVAAASVMLVCFAIVPANTEPCGVPLSPLQQVPQPRLRSTTRPDQARGTFTVLARCFMLAVFVVIPERRVSKG